MSYWISASTGSSLENMAESRETRLASVNSRRQCLRMLDQ